MRSIRPLEKEMERYIKTENYAAIAKYYENNKEKFSQILVNRLDLDGLENYNEDLIFIAQSFRVRAYESKTPHKDLEQSLTLYRQALNNCTAMQGRRISEELLSQATLVRYCIEANSYHHACILYNNLLDYLQETDPSELVLQLEKVKKHFEKFLTSLNTKYKDKNIRAELGINIDFINEIEQDIKNINQLLKKALHNSKKEKDDNEKNKRIKKRKHAETKATPEEEIKSTVDILVSLAELPSVKKTIVNKDSKEPITKKANTNTTPLESELPYTNKFGYKMKKYQSKSEQSVGQSNPFTPRLG